MIHLRPFILLCSLSLLGLSGAAAQGSRQQEELTDYYRKWLDENVVYIITEEERDVFLKLITDAEKDHLIEQFWLRRDPDTRTAVNEFKEEHYRRLQYANERFHAGIPGWKTDRGRIYITFGPPDRIETHPVGGSYDRKPYEGGGWTSVYPFERWEYRSIEGVGEDIELEFVDNSGGNLYKLTMDSQEKDEFLTVPGMGLTRAEALAGAKSPSRVNRIRESGLAEWNPFERAKDHPFQKAELLMNLSKPPMIHFDDLKALVTTQVQYSQLPFKAVSHHFQIDGPSHLVTVTVAFDNSEIAFDEGQGWRQSRLQIYGLVSTLTRRRVFEFDEEIVADYSPEQVESIRHIAGSYQKKIILLSGSYKLDLVVRDAVSGKTGTLAIPIQIPSSTEGKLTTSSIILSKEIQPAQEDAQQPYVVGLYKIKPQVDSQFQSGDSLGFYVEAYNYQVDQASLEPALEIQYAITGPGTEPTSYRVIRGGIGYFSDRASVARMIQLDGLEPGNYELVFSLTDTLSGQSVTQRAPFEVN